MTIRDWPERERPREKLLASGPQRLSDAELLAVLFGSGSRGINAVELGGRLLREFGCLRALMGAGRERCRATPGLGTRRYGLLQAALELSRRHFQQEAAAGPPMESPAATRTFLVAQLRDSYVAQSLTNQVIPAGSSSYTFSVQVLGDALNEANETFFVNVSNVGNATVADAQAVGTISNDDPLPALSISDATVVEGNSGTVSAIFTVTLGAASGQSVSVNYATADGSATQPADYTASSGTLVFTAGQTSATISVAVAGDTAPETNESFFVNLSAPVNATIADGQGVATINNDDVPVTVAPGSLLPATVGVPYAQALTASGGSGPYTFAVASGSLPAGLSLSGSGSLSGTATAGGSFSFNIIATDSSGSPGPFSGVQAYVLAVNPATVTLPAGTFANAVLGTPYNSVAATPAAGGTAPYSYAIVAGALPSGLTLNTSTGAIAGTPTALGSFSFTVRATDSSTGTGPYANNRPYALEVVDLPPTAVNSALTVSYNAAATTVPLALGGGATTSLVITTAPVHGTALVTGPATITYQPNTAFAGSDSLVYRALNSGGQSLPATVAFTVSSPVVTVTGSAPLTATVATAYAQTFTFTGGAQPWSNYQVTGLPADIAVTGTSGNTVTVSGSPTQAGTFNVTVAATESSSGTGPFSVDRSFVLTVAAPALTMSPIEGTALTPTYNTPFSQSFIPAGGVGPYAFAMVTSAGSLPAGLSFNASNGSIAGTPTGVGSTGFAIIATDTGASGASAPFTVQRNYTLTVAAPAIVLGPTTLPASTVAVNYSQSLTASGGIAPYSFALSAGTLPGGLTLDAAGSLTGTPSAGGNFTFTVTATDGGSGGVTGSRVYTLQVAPPALVITPTALMAPTVGVPYNQALAAAGGTAPYAFAVTSGALPAGLAMSSAGSISGTPTAAGVAVFTVTLTDSSTGTGPFTSTQSHTLMTGAGTQTVSFAPVTPIMVSPTPITLTATASSGLTPLTFATSSPGGVCTVNGDQLLAIGVGTCVVTASQVGDTNYLPASVEANVLIVAAVPGAPVITGTTLNAGTVLISFDPPAFTGGSAITGYAATCTPLDGGDVRTGATAASPVSVANLAHGTFYVCTVAASNAIGAGPASAAVVLDVPAVAVPTMSTTAIAALSLLLALLSRAGLVGSGTAIRRRRRGAF